MDASAKLRLAISDLKAVDEEIAALSTGMDALPLSQVAARVSKGAKIAETAASRVLRAAEAADAASTKTTEVIVAAEVAAAEAAAAQAAVVQAADKAAAAAQAAQAAAAAAAALEVEVKPVLQSDGMYEFAGIGFGDGQLLLLVATGSREIIWLLPSV